MQSKKSSLVEQCLNVGSGYIVSLFVWCWIVQPVWGFDATLQESLHVNALFTVISIARGYIWRRVFNAKEKV